MFYIKDSSVNKKTEEILHWQTSFFVQWRLNTALRIYRVAAWKVLIFGVLLVRENTDPKNYERGHFSRSWIDLIFLSGTALNVCDILNRRWFLNYFWLQKLFSSKPRKNKSKKNFSIADLAKRLCPSEHPCRLNI